MGRHRSDPRGLARILIAALAVALALALLVVGGMALVNALTSKGSGPGSAGTPSTNTAADGERRSPNTSSRRAQPSNEPGSQAPPLLIKVTGPATAVFVTVAGGGGQVLQQGTLNTGESRRYDQTPLNVVVANAGAVQVAIHGRLQSPGRDGQRGEWFVPRKQQKG